MIFHEKVRLWRKKEAMLRTLRRRPDMFREQDFMTTKADRRLLAEVYDQLRQEKASPADSDSPGQP